MTLDAPTSNSSCPPSPEYQKIIDFAAQHMYEPQRLGNIDELKNKFNCQINSRADAERLAIDALQSADQSIDYLAFNPERFVVKAGMGMQLNLQDGKLTVDRVLPNGPAQHAGLRAGDTILSINGESQTGQALVDSVEQIRAQRNDKSSAAAGGIGAGLRRNEDGPVTINHVNKNSPAEKAGLMEGDKILAVDGQRIGTEHLSETDRRIHGKAGSTVSLAVERAGTAIEINLPRVAEDYPQAVLDVERNGEKMQLSVDRSLVEARNVDSAIASQRIPNTELTLPENSAYLRINNFFSQNTVSDVWQTLKRPANQQGNILGNSDSLILDLRDNTGGLVNQVPLVASLFMDNGDLFTIKSRVASDPANPQYKTDEVKLDPGSTAAGSLPGNDHVQAMKPGQLIILVNQNTVGAAEMLAAALQQNTGATLIGTETAGYGEVKMAHSIDRGMIAVPVGRIYTPNGKWLGDGRGAGHALTPSIRVENTGRTDAQLEEALRLIRFRNGQKP